MKYRKGFPRAIICDIDGTLAQRTNRGPYDMTRVGDDDLVIEIAAILDKFKEEVTIIIVTGRDEGECADATKEWLFSHGISHRHLFMRPEGNRESDDIIKGRIYDEKIEPHYDVMFVLDDRDRVVKMWRERGLKCLQVEYGDF